MNDGHSQGGGGGRGQPASKGGGVVRIPPTPLKKP